MELGRKGRQWHNTGFNNKNSGELLFFEARFGGSQVPQVSLKAAGES